jgi:hypothetical protein
MAQHAPTYTQSEETHWFVPIHQDKRERFESTMSYDRGKHYFDINTIDTINDHFLQNVNKGDKIWFITPDAEVIGVATYNYYHKRLQYSGWLDEDKIQDLNTRLGNDADVCCTDYYKLNRKLVVNTYVTTLDRPTQHTNTSGFDAPIEYYYVTKYVPKYDIVIYS